MIVIELSPEHQTLMIREATHFRFKTINGFE